MSRIIDEKYLIVMFFIINKIYPDTNLHKNSDFYISIIKKTLLIISLL